MKVLEEDEDGNESFGEEEDGDDEIEIEIDEDEEEPEEPEEMGEGGARETACTGLELRRSTCLSLLGSRLGARREG